MTLAFKLFFLLFFGGMAGSSNSGGGNDLRPDTFKTRVELTIETEEGFAERALTLATAENGEEKARNIVFYAGRPFARMTVSYASVDRNDRQRIEKLFQPYGGCVRLEWMESL